jgi:signal transduction histidine kinase
VRNEKLAATGQLVAQLSHELNNPIHNVQNSLEVIRRRLPEADERRAFLDMARAEIERMSRLTRQLLDFHRPVRPAFADVDVMRLLEDTLAMSQRELQDARVITQVTCAEDVPLIRASADHVRQVFLNLAINAVEAMPDGGRLTVDITREGDAVAIRIADTGVGIPANARSKIFDAFFTTKGAMSGVGLGLSVTWGIVRDHHGTIDVSDAPGGGAVFTVRLPVHQPDEDPA